VSAVALEVNPFFYATFAEDVMTASNAFLESKTLQQATQIVESNRRIGMTAENTF